MVEQQSWRETVTWFLFGFLLATGSLLFLMGGFLLMAAMFVILVVVFPLAALVVAVAGVARRAAAPVPVAARLVSASGVCARKVQYRLGDEFLFLNSKASPAMCGPATHGLRPAVEGIRAGGPGTSVEITCPLSGNVLMFDLFPKKESVPELRQAA